MTIHAKISLSALAFALVLAPILAHPPAPANVPPGLEMVVMDPNVDPLGNPAIVQQPVAPGLSQIDIPQGVIVHRFYYTGDRTFQGPFVKGGPTIVVVSHPSTGERLYIPVQMLPGAPKVTYRHNSIDYDFGNQGMTICFSAGLHHQPTVDYRTGKTIVTSISEATAKVQTAGRNLYDRTGIPAATQKVAQGTKNAVITSVDRASDLGKAVLQPPLQAAKLIPGINTLFSAPEDRAQNLRDQKTREAQSVIQRSESVFIPAVP